jgi:cysteine desulfurase
VLEPITFGGGQQRRLRPGTLPVDLIAGLGEAAAVAAAGMESDLEHLSRLKAQLLDGIGPIEGLQINGHELDGYPGILNVGIADIEGESLMLALEPLCVASGSACNSQSQEPSYVLRALGRSDQEAQSAIRFSFGRQTTSADISRAIECYQQAVIHLRELAPASVA